MKEQRKKMHFRKCISWLLVLSMLLSITASDGGFFQQWLHLELAKRAQAATGEISDKILLDSTVVPDGNLLSYLKQQVMKADSSLQESRITVKDLAQKVTTELTLPASVQNLTGLGWARNASKIDLSQTQVGAIAADEFNLCNMTEVVLPDSLTTINSRAFKDCRSLAKINISNVNYIGEDAFANCEKLTDNVIEDIKSPVAYLGSGAFQGCSALTKGIVPVITDASLTHTVPVKLFSNCRNMVEVYFKDSALQTIADSAFEGTGEIQFAGSSGSLGDQLPGTVTNIGESAFMQSKVKKLDLSNTSLTEIKKTTFYYADLSEGITLPETLKTIREEAFCHSNLTQVTLPNSVTALEPKSFQYTQSLGKLVLSKNLTELPAQVFQGAGCTTLVAGEGANFNPGNNVGLPTPLQVSFNGCSAAESQLTVIGEFAFNAAMLYDDTFLKGLTKLTTIGEQAFSYTCLKELTIPACVTTLGKEAFRGIYLLEEVTFAEGSQVTEFPEMLFGYNKKYTNTVLYSDIQLKKIQLPKGLVSIGDYCFGWCLSLDTVGYPGKMEQGSVNFPDSVTTLGSYAFTNCSVYAQKSNQESEEETTNLGFAGEISVAGDTAAYAITPLILSNGGLKTVNIPDSVTYLGEGLFKDSVTLSTLNIGKGVKEIPDSMCSGCGIYPTKETEKDYLRDSSGKAMSSSPDLHEEDYTPIDFVGLKNLTLPDGVTRIGKRAFEKCYALCLNDRGELPESLEAIDEYAFYQCKSMEKVVFPSTLQSIGAYAFAEAAQSVPESYVALNQKTLNLSHQYAGLKVVDFTYAVELGEIGKYAFTKTNLRDITFPEKVHLIPESVCEGCYNLSSVNNMSDAVAKIEEKAFKDCYRLSTVTLPFSAEWAKTIFGDAAANESSRLTLIPTENEEDVSIHWGKDMDLTLNCFKNFTTTTLTVTESDKESENEQNDLLQHDINEFVKASMDSSAKNQINLYGKKLGKTSLKVTGKVDLFNEGLNAGNLTISISHVYNVTVQRLPVEEIVMESNDIIREGNKKEMYLSCADNKTRTLTASYTPEDTTDEVMWSVDDPGVIEIKSQTTKDGTSTVSIAPLSAGDTVLRVGVDNVWDTCNIHVRVPAKQIKLDSSSVNLATGATYQLKAEVIYDSQYEGMSAAYPDTYAFSSSAEEIASVDASTGLVTALKEGTARITVKSRISGVSAICNITVKDGYTTPVSSITLSKSTLEMNVNSEATLTAEILPADADKTVTWSSSNEKVATVNAGVVKALSVGTVTIGATTGNGKRATCTVTVKSPAKQLKIKATSGSTSKVYLKKGGSMTLGKYYSNKDCTDTFKFSAKKNKVGSVSQTGALTTGKKTGKFVVTLKAYNGDKVTASAKIKVFVVKKEIKAKKIKIKGKKTVKAGKRICLTAALKPSKSTAGLSWNSSKPSVATVDSYGIVTGVKKGKTKIKVTASTGKKKTITLKVN